jgi:hypothetical protein
VLDEIRDHVEDVRASPDDRRQARFKARWRDYSERDRTYTDRTLRMLTWNNLGYRLARAEDSQSGTRPEDLDDIYEIAAEGYRDGSLRL